MTPSFEVIHITETKTMPTATRYPASAMPAVEVIPLDRIHSGENVRSDLSGIDDLAQSISRHGVLTAITVMRRGDGAFDLIAGQRRVAAARLAGLKVIPAVVQDTTSDDERLRRQLAENLDREGLRDLDQAQAVQRLLELGASVESVAETVHSTPDTVQAWAGLLRLPRKVRRLIDSGRMTAADAHHLVALLDDAAAMRAALDRIASGYSAERAAATVERERQLTRKIAAAGDKLNAEGCPIIEAPHWDFSAASKTQRLGKGYRDVQVPVRKHAKLPCHAAYINHHSGDVVYVCTNRNIHAGEEGSGVADLRAERAARRTEKKALREAHTVRLGALQNALRAHAITTEEATTHVLRLSIDAADYRDLELAATMLDVAIPHTHRLDAERHALLTYAGSGPDALLDVALAVAMARAERALRGERMDWRSTLIAEHARLIRTTGVHHLTEAEERLLRNTLPGSWEPSEASSDAQGGSASAA